MDKNRFYASGLKFTCKQCSSCCRYDEGYVYLSEKDLKKLIAEIEIDRNGFIEKYCRWVTDVNGNEVLSLKEKFNRDCILWDNGCMVYNARPLQCRTFPFWESIASSPQTWESAAGSCPGINTGFLHTADAIEEYIKMRLLEPIIAK